VLTVRPRVTSRTATGWATASRPGAETPYANRVPSVFRLRATSDGRVLAPPAQSRRPRDTAPAWCGHPHE
jgi:hypothetical protein